MTCFSRDRPQSFHDYISPTRDWLQWSKSFGTPDSITTTSHHTNGYKTESTVRFSTTVAGSQTSDLSFNNPNYGRPAPEINMAENYREFDTTPIIPEIRISSYSFRIREIILGVVSVVSMVTCLILITIVAKNTSSDSLSINSGKTSAQIAVNTMCTEPGCLKAAAYAVANMNQSVNPCDDFYQYACGNYPHENPLDPDVNQHTVFWDLYYENEDRLRTILEQPSVRTATFSSERKLKDFFMSCIDDYGKMNAGGRVFIEKIVEPLGGWDVINTFNNQSFNFQRNLEKTNIEFWTAALFTFRVATDPYDRPNRVIEIDMSGMGMYWMYYIRPQAQQIRTDYKKFIRTVGQHLARDSGLNLDQEMLDNKTEIFVEDAYDIEFQLANITANTFPAQNPHSVEKRITLSNLTTITNNVVDFVSFFRNMFGQENINGNTRVILHEDDWLLRTIAMVGNIPEAEKARKLQNYLIWRLARRYAQELSWDYIHANRKFYDDIYGYKNFWGTWYHCFYHADKSMPDALGALFAKLHFKDKNKEKAEEIVRYVKQSLIDSVDTNTFMDDETKQLAKAKLSASTDKMGYPDIYMRETDIDSIYEHISINRSDYFQNLLNLNKFDQADWTKRLTSAEDRSRWFYNSYDTTMVFYNRWNQLLVPAGLLQFPVYQWAMPHYFNFGAIGGLIGHYLVHSIDRWGSSYNANGQYGAWYSNTTKEGYNNMTQCYAEQFSNQTMGPFKIVGQSDPITIPVRGSRFAWEGLAETSGVKAAYKAYKRWISDNGEEKLTPTSHYSNDQSFFLTYAQLACHTRTDALSYYYAQIQKVPENIRLNVALSQLNEFTTAFKCPAGSTMNSPTKCETF